MDSPRSSPRESPTIKRLKSARLANFSPLTVNSYECDELDARRSLETVDIVRNMLRDSLFDENVVNVSLSELSLVSSSAKSKRAEIDLSVVRHLSLGKHGLGFVFNSGYVGIIHNDNTQTVLSPGEVTVQFSERNSVGRYEHNSYVKSNVPSDLISKVNKINLFAEYISSNVTDCRLESYSLIKALDDIVSDEDAILLSQESAFTFSNPNIHHPFVKSWSSTDYAYLFHLSNHTIHVRFNTGSEILFASDLHFVYINRKGHQRVCTINEIQLNSTENKNIMKKLRHVRDLLDKLEI